MPNIADLECTSRITNGEYSAIWSSSKGLFLVRASLDGLWWGNGWSSQRIGLFACFPPFGSGKEN